MIWYIPIEPLEERYTAQMFKWVQAGFSRKKLPFRFVSGETLTSCIETGEVLDAEGTNYYKAVQLQRICKGFKDDEIQNGDIFFFGDLWFPGLEMIRYIAQQRCLDIKIAGVHYAGVFDPNDFVYKMRKWAMWHEIGWLVGADAVFVGSNYHKKLIQDGCSKFVQLDNIHATGLVWDTEDVQSEIKEKERTVIFPHRLDSEKNPQLFFDLAREIHRIDPTVKFVITSSRKTLASNIHPLCIPDFVELKIGLTKQQYYDELAKAKVLFSSAYQETFGYALNEGLQLGCVPICPRRLSYPEVLEGNDDLLYETFDEAVAKVFYSLNYVNQSYQHYTHKYSKNIDKMIDVCLSLK
jgi:glycosyltransferase involved in cell wall biosynthesis